MHIGLQYMYGVDITEDFADPEGLLHQADFFMMEPIKSAVGLIIAKTLSLETFKEMVVLGEKYREANLQRSCADFILANVEDLGDDLLSELVRPSQHNFPLLS